MYGSLSPHHVLWGRMTFQTLTEMGHLSLPACAAN
jgi:hypothetical protein